MRHDPMKLRAVTLGAGIVIGLPAWKKCGVSPQHTPKFMKNNTILGVILIVAGAAILAYQQFSYRSRETVIDIGPIKATAETTKTVPIPPIIGWALLGSGALVMVFGARSKS
jgi:uncharacterized membrane protein